MEGHGLSQATSGGKMEMPRAGAWEFSPEALSWLKLGPLKTQVRYCCRSGPSRRMTFREHLRITGDALKNWLLAQIQDSIAVGCLWWIGLHFLKVPWAPFWAGLAAILQFVPHLGPVLGMLGPVLAAAIRWADWEHPFYVLMLYAGVVVVDGFLLQPYLMKRSAKVPIWASILAPIVLGFVIPFWGVLLAPPLLAVVYAYKTRRFGAERGS